jgi:glycerol-3-phosphate acyltransferase PlsY
MVGVWPYLTLPAAGALLTWVLFAAALRYVGLASVVAAATMPGFVGVAMAIRGWPWSTAWPFVAVTGAMAVLVAYRHRGNLARLANGGEPRLGGG